MRNFKKYDIWQLSHQFTLEVYKTTNLLPKDENVWTYRSTS